MLDDTHVMVDIETLDVTFTSAVYQVSAVSFVPSAIANLSTCSEVEGLLLSDTNNVFNQLIDPLSFLGNPKFSVSESTIQFVRKHNRKIFIQALQDGSDINLVLSNFVLWLKQVGPKHIWAKDPSFDICILRTAMQNCGIAAPAMFRDERSVRTAMAYNQMKNQYRLYYNDTNLVAHNALHDCLLQINDVMAFLAPRN